MPSAQCLANLWPGSTLFKVKGFGFIAEYRHSGKIKREERDGKDDRDTVAHSGGAWERKEISS